MAIVTINGQRGSGAPEIGVEVAKRLQYSYVDRQVLGEAAKRLGMTEEVLEEKELSVQPGSRILRVLKRIADEMGTATTGRFPLFYGLSDVSQDYDEIMDERLLGEHLPDDQNILNVDDQSFLNATVSVVREIADAGNVVIVGRASNVILKDYSHALHVGLISELASRIALVAQREGLPLDEARESTIRAERARVQYFRKYFDVSADDPSRFHLVMNTHLLGTARAVDIVVASVQSK